MTFQIKRIYAANEPTDGIRVLIDRLWPRGVKKTEAHLDQWMKDIAPSATLRQWFKHDPERFKEFGRRYVRELKGNPCVEELRRLGRARRVTLLYGARDPQVNHALILQSVLRRRK